MEIAEIGGDAKGRADIIDSEVAEYEIVRARAQFEQFVAGGIARLPVGGARAGEMRAHGIAGGIDAAHHHRLAFRTPAGNAANPGDIVVALVGQQQHLAPRPRPTGHGVERTDGRSEERRVGEGCGSTVRFQWSPSPEKYKKP